MDRPTLTDDQVKDLIRQGRSQRSILREYTIGYSRIQRIASEMARHGVSPEHELDREVPDGLKMSGISDMRTNSEGKPIWYKFNEDKERQYQLMVQALETMSQDVPRLPPLDAPSGTDQDLCNLFVLSDIHLGMLAWAAEGGDDWNMEIAEDMVISAFSAMMARSPKASVAIIGQLGDFLHFDSNEAVTPAHRHQLDAAARFSALVDAGIRIQRRLVDMALLHHDHVHLVVAEGNHDPISSKILRKTFGIAYENEPRVTVDQSELPYYVYQHGKVMLAFHHGHIRNNAQLPLLIAAQYSEIWGNTDFRYVHTGHRHHEEEKEHSGITVIQHPTLTAKDAHAARHLYLSNRRCMGMTYHKDHGCVARCYVTPGMIGY